VRWKGWSREGDATNCLDFAAGRVCIPCWDFQVEEECRTEVVSDCLVQSGWGAVQTAECSCADVELCSTRSRFTCSPHPHPAQVLSLSCGSCFCLAMGDAVHGNMRFLSPSFQKMVMYHESASVPAPLGMD
jgi:hypothetical protein